MMRGLALLIVMGVAAGACAKQTPPWRNDARSQVIWDAAHNRFVDQFDYWFEDGDFPRCIQLLRVLHDLEPNNYETATNLGWLLESIKEPDAALAVYVRFRKDNPGDPDAPWPEANFYFKREAYAKVVPLLESSLSLRPHANSYRLLAHSYERMGMLADSKRVWTRYLAVNPSDEPAKANLRRVNNKIGATR